MFGVILRAAAVVLALALPAVAAPRGLIRDAEIDATLRRTARPILQAAGLNPSIVRILVVNDPDANAFAAGGQNIFLNSGLLMRLGDLDALRSVIAHETGHIAGGHLVRRDEALNGARGIALIGLLAAAATTVAGGGDAGIAVAATTAQAAQRNLLAYSRGEELAADQAGLRFLAATGADPHAALEVMQIFRNQDRLATLGIDARTQTHPMWTERITMLEGEVAAMPAGTPPGAENLYWQARMVAKLAGFLKTPAEVDRLYPPRDRSEPALLARAILAHRRPDPEAALAGADALIALRPEDPYYHELKGQFLLENGQAAPAVAAYREAVRLAPKSPLILAGLGRALLNLDEAGADQEARDVLVRSSTLDKANAAVLRDLALAEARTGDEGAAMLATAERFLLEGRFNDATRQAVRAGAVLPEGSPGWKRSQDVITLSRRAATAAKQEK